MIALVKEITQYVFIATLQAQQISDPLHASDVFMAAVPRWHLTSGGGCRKLVVIVGLAKDRGIAADVLQMIVAFMRWPRHGIDNSKHPAFFWTAADSVDDMWSVRAEREKQCGPCAQLRLCFRDGIATKKGHRFQEMGPHLQTSAEAPF